MAFIVFEEEAFNYLDAQLENFVKRMDRISHKTYYKPEDVMAIIAVVEDKKKDMRFRKRTG